MKIDDVKTLVKNVNKKSINMPIMLIGATGIGKSQSLYQVAKKNNIGFIDLRLATQEVTDLIGIPRSKNGKTYWDKPNWFPEEGTKGILALEEVNRSPEDVRQAIFQLLTEWKLHTHKLPKGWTIVALINPDNGHYHVNQLDPAFKRRFCQIIVDSPDSLDWSIWAKQNGISEEIIRFSNTFENMFSSNEDIELEAIPTRAGLEALDKMYSNKVIPANCLAEVARGIIGNEAGSTFVQSLNRNFETPLSAEEILDRYEDKCNNNSNITIRDKFTGHIKQKKNAMIYSTSIDVLATLIDNPKISPEQAKNLEKFLLDLPDENFVHFAMKLPTETEDIIHETSEPNKKHKDTKIAQKIIEVNKELGELNE